MPVGELKRNKKLNQQIGDILKNFSQFGSNIIEHPVTKKGFEIVGDVIGEVAIPIPVVGGAIGELSGKLLNKQLEYGNGLVGEIGGMISGEKNIGDVLSYIPNRIYDDVVNSDIGKVIRGEMNWRDAILNTLENEAMINILAPDKTHAWKDDQGNYHKEYVDGAKMVVGTWVEQPNTQPRPSDNGKIIGIKNGEVIREGWQ